MPTIRAKGHDITYQPIRDSANRRATQIANKIIETLCTIGIRSDDIDIPEERMPLKTAPASVRFYFDGNHCLYNFVRARTYIDNLQIVQKVLEYELNSLLESKKTPEEFIAEFKEDPEIEEKRKAAREALGFPHDHHDLESINAEFKKRSRALHPDMPGGDTQKFKELNEAHKTLKRELE